MKAKNWPIYTVLSIAVLTMVIPFLWMILTSFKTFEDSTKIPMEILPEVWILSNYKDILDVFPIALWLGNSGLANVYCVIGQIFFGSLADNV